MTPARAAELNALAALFAEEYGDTPEITAERRAAMVAELLERDTRPAVMRAAWKRRRTDLTAPAV